MKLTLGVVLGVAGVALVVACRITLSQFSELSKSDQSKEFSEYPLVQIAMAGMLPVEEGMGSPELLARRILKRIYTTGVLGLLLTLTGTILIAIGIIARHPRTLPPIIHD